MSTVVFKAKLFIRVDFPRELISGLKLHVPH